MKDIKIAKLQKKKNIQFIKEAGASKSTADFWLIFVYVCIYIYI
jgi:hypothetical protein